MNPENLTWRLLTAEELTNVYLNEMRRDFPAGELKPLSMILNSEAAGTAHTWGVYKDDALVAYLLMVRPVGCEVSQLDYFAVLPQYRAGGIGAVLLAALPDHEKGAQAILIEAECPEKAEDEAMAVRRLGFYARCGAKDTGWTEHLFDAWFRVLVLPCCGGSNLPAAAPWVSPSGAGTSPSTAPMAWRSSFNDGALSIRADFPDMSRAPLLGELASVARLRG